jgi:hypothetical protein
MSAASDIFESLRKLMNLPNTGKSPQQQLVEYCQNILGGIERVHFDFKQKANAQTAKPEESDIKNLAKAVSGFANGAGGVLIWGIEDETIAPVPIANVSEFIADLLQRSHQLTSPAVIGIDGDFIPADSIGGSGFGIILVPESDLPPHQVLSRIATIQHHYYVRSASSFAVATHSQLEDMFGRRPRPILSVEFDVEVKDSGNEVWITVLLENKGRGIARYPFLSLEVDRPYGLSKWGADDHGHFGLPVIRKGESFRNKDNTWYRSMEFGSQDGFVIHSGMRHPITKIALVLAENRGPTSKDLRLRWRVAAEGIPLQANERELTDSELAQLVQR